MRDIPTFLAEVADSRLKAQIEERKAFRVPSDLELPPALRIALRHNWRISPVLARSELAVNSASVGVPSSDREQIEYWLATYPDANWSLVTGPASGVAALEIGSGLAHSLAYLTDGDTGWQRTLCFEVGSRWFAVFALVPNLPVVFGYPGLRLHTRGRILIPPSRTADGGELAYTNPFAPLLPAPDWLCCAPRLR